MRFNVGQRVLITGNPKYAGIGMVVRIDYSRAYPVIVKVREGCGGRGGSTISFTEAGVRSNAAHVDDPANNKITVHFDLEDVLKL